MCEIGALFVVYTGLELPHRFFDYKLLRTLSKQLWTINALHGWMEGHHHTFVYQISTACK